MAKLFLVFVVVFLVSSVESAIDRQRLAVTPQAVQHFDIDAMIGDGPWYVQARLAPCSWYGSSEFTDFEQQYIKDGKTIISQDSWRNDACVTVRSRLTPNSGRGCFLAKDSIGNAWSGKYIVAATDYKSYEISWVCAKPSVMGDTCDDTSLSVKTRARHPEPHVWKTIEQELSNKWGMTLTDLQRVKHDKQCIRQQERKHPRNMPRFKLYLPQIKY